MSSPDISLVGRRVLVVEDNRVLAATVEDMARDLGCEVVATAHDPTEAMSTISSGSPLDVAILDVDLGGWLSYGIADALDARGVPFVVATGYRGQVVDSRFKQNVVVFKPFTVETLELSLKHALSRTPASASPPT